MSTARAASPKSASYQLAHERFGREKLAKKYPSAYRNTWRDRRELKCILTCARYIRAGGRVLDLPCGTGRLTQPLVNLGYRVSGADNSAAMLERAQENYRQFQQEHPDAPPVTFEVRDVLATGYADGYFDGVLCIRLMHHFADANTRRAALRELARISRGPIVVTFLNSFALDRYTSWIRARIKGRRKQINQLPISLSTFKADITAAGLVIKKKMAAHWGISSRWFLVLEKA